MADGHPGAGRVRWPPIRVDDAATAVRGAAAALGDRGRPSARLRSARAALCALAVSSEVARRHGPPERPAPPARHGPRPGFRVPRSLPGGPAAALDAAPAASRAGGPHPAPGAAPRPPSSASAICPRASVGHRARGVQRPRSDPPGTADSARSGGRPPYAERDSDRSAGRGPSGDDRSRDPGRPSHHGGAARRSRSRG